MSNEETKEHLEPNGEKKESLEPDTEKKEETNPEGEKKEYLDPDREKLLELKEERIRKEGEEEEEVKKEVPDTPFRRFLKKIEFFWDYYKWLVIIPVAIIIITVITIVSYIEENRPRQLEVVMMNEIARAEMVEAVENDYRAATNAMYEAKDIRIEYGMQYPDLEHFDGVLTDTISASMQKFNAMVIAKRVDVFVTNTWVLDAYALQNSATDLRTILDEDFLAAHEEDIYYAKNEDGEDIPVGIFLKSPIFTESYEEDMPPLIATVNTAPHNEERIKFIKWVAELR